jgi:hypothetical protein
VETTGMTQQLQRELQTLQHRLQASMVASERCDRELQVAPTSAER